MLDEYIRYAASDSPTLAVALPQWARAMLGCFTVEAKLRLLTGKYFPAESVTKDLGEAGGVLDLLFRKLPFADEEQVFLRRCVRLRNKLIHCEPDEVRRLVQEFVPAFQPPSVFKKFRVPEGGLSPEAIIDAVTSGSGGVNVPDTKSRDQGFLGWMMQAAQDGTFDLAAEIFRRGIEIISAKAALEPKA